MAYIPKHIPESFTQVGDELQFIEKLYMGGLIKEDQLQTLGEKIHKAILSSVNEGFGLVLTNIDLESILNVDDDGKVFLEML